MYIFAMSCHVMYVCVCMYVGPSKFCIFKHKIMRKCRYLYNLQPMYKNAAMILVWFDIWHAKSSEKKHPKSIIYQHLSSAVRFYAVSSSQVDNSEPSKTAPENFKYTQVPCTGMELAISNLQHLHHVNPHFLRPPVKPPLPRLRPMASISSMKMIEGASTVQWTMVEWTDPCPSCHNLTLKTRMKPTFHFHDYRMKGKRRWYPTLLDIT